MAQCIVAKILGFDVDVDVDVETSRRVASPGLASSHLASPILARPDLASRVRRQNVCIFRRYIRVTKNGERERERTRLKVIGRKRRERKRIGRRRAQQKDGGR